MPKEYKLRNPTVIYTMPGRDNINIDADNMDFIPTIGDSFTFGNGTFRVMDMVTDYAKGIITVVSAEVT